MQVPWQQPIIEFWDTVILQVPTVHEIANLREVLISERLFEI